MYTHYLPLSRIYIYCVCVLLLACMGYACSDLGSQESGAEDQQKQGNTRGRSQYDPSQVERPGTYVDTQFSLSNEVGEWILAHAREWEKTQIQEADEYAQPRMCAHNVSKVLEMSGLFAYGDYLIPNILNAVRVRGGWVQALDSRDKRGFVRSLNEIFNGHLPVGALLNGCLYKDCGGKGGDGHIAIIGHTDEDGIVYLYHNNWYRPDNEEGQRKPHMVSEAYYDEHGLRRQWMATPWIKVYRDEKTDLIVDVDGLLPALDDLDPFMGFFLTVSILPEQLQELELYDNSSLFCPSGLIPDPMLGACVNGFESNSDVYGRFSDAMVEECVAKGLGRACSTAHQLETDEYKVSLYRWSRNVYESLRGDQACVQGLYLDHEIGYCVQQGDEEAGIDDEVFGPFSRDLVAKCFRWGGGNACASGRWSLSMLKTLQTYHWLP